MGVLEIFNGCPGDMWLASWSYLVGVLEIFDWCPGYNWWVSWRYL